MKQLAFLFNMRENQAEGLKHCTEVIERTTPDRVSKWQKRAAYWRERLNETESELLEIESALS
jgi:hypothetical protein